MAYNKEMKYTKRTYRIEPHQDKKVKKLSRKRKISESEVVRSLIEKEDENLNR